MHVYLASNGVKKLKIFSIRQANNVLKNETNMFEKYLKRVDTKDSTGTGIYESTKMSLKCVTLGTVPLFSTFHPS